MIHSRIIAASGGVNDRGIFGGGTLVNSTTTYSNSIDYIGISTIQNASDFGDLSANRTASCGASNGANNRGVFAGGYTSSYVNIIEYVTISTLGNTTDFGDLTNSRGYVGGCSNRINNRGVFAGGNNSSVLLSTIDYITISSTGNAATFGSLSGTSGPISEHSGLSNGINNRGVYGGGENSNDIVYITISSAGDAIDFGNLTNYPAGQGSTSNGVNNRGLFAGGNAGEGYPISTGQYITITSTGNAINFGNLTQSRWGLVGNSNDINNRGVFGGGTVADRSETNSIINAGVRNTIDYYNISVTGVASDFGDLTVARRWLGASSNA